MVSNTALQVLIDFVIVLGLRWLPVSVSLCYFPVLFSLAAEERKLTHGVAVSVHGVPFLPEVSQGQGRMLTRGAACLLSPTLLSSCKTLTQESQPPFWRILNVKR